MSSTGRPLVMGVLNVTPDSFSDGGQFLEAGAAIARGRAMVAEGADVVDVGGESSRPGAEPVDELEELRRVIPVVEALSAEVRVSIDTVKPRVASAAVAAGASLVNDISARLWPVAATTGAGWIAMHMQGNPRDMQRHPTYADVVGEVHLFLLDRARTAANAGVTEIWVDPGIGFGKTPEHNLALLARVGELSRDAGDRGFGTMLGTSRKSFLARFGTSGGAIAGPEHRLEASLATAVWSMANGVGMVRVHDVAATIQAAELVAGQAGEVADGSATSAEGGPR
jgi:dihydropteroate synthase